MTPVLTLRPCRGRSTRLLLAVTVWAAAAALLISGLVTASAASAASAPPGAAPSAKAAPQTTITLKVRGCGTCRVQAVQNYDGQLQYTTNAKRVRNAKVSFKVPTSRTHKMGFLVFAPFDSYAQDGIPMLAVTAFKAKKPGTKVSDSYPSKRRQASGCWAGTSRSRVSNVLVVRKRTEHGQTLAAGWLRRTWGSKPYWVRVHGGAYHVSDPSICR